MKGKNKRTMISGQRYGFNTKRSAHQSPAVHFDTSSGERIRILRERSGLTAKELADRLDISPSTQSRIENGQDSRISVDLLLKYADYFHVTLDYLTGRTDIEEIPATIASLGLTKKAAENILHRRADLEILNRLFEQDLFCALTRRMYAFLSGRSTVGLEARNETLLIAEKAILEEIGAGYPPESVKEALKDFRHLNDAALIRPAELNIAILSEQFRKVILGIRSDLKTGKPLSENFRAEDSIDFVRNAFRQFPEQKAADPKTVFHTILKDLYTQPQFQKLSAETKEEMERVLFKAAAEISGENQPCNSKEPSILMVRKN